MDLGAADRWFSWIIWLGLIGLIDNKIKENKYLKKLPDVQNKLDELESEKRKPIYRIKDCCIGDLIDREYLYR